MEIIGRDRLATGRKFHWARHQLRLRSGEILEREFVEHPGSVVLLPMLPGDRVVLIRNYRHALDRVFWELPAGTAVPGELRVTTAARELLEETGYHAGRLTPLRTIYPALGLADEEMEIFLAEALVPGAAAPEADEQIEIEIVPWQQALAMSRDGTIQDAKTLVALWHHAWTRQP